MTHLRIRKSNTKDGYLMPGLKYGASQVVVAHDQIFVLGQTGLTLDNKGFVGEGNPAQQAENAMLNVKMLLEESGATMNDICKIIPYTTDDASTCCHRNAFDVLLENAHIENAGDD